MALHLITGYKGSPHITAADQGTFNAGCVGAKDYVLSIGRMFEAEIVSNNTIRIYDGALVMRGRHANLEQGTYEDITISNGTQSMHRNDLIVARYEKNLVTGVENVTFRVAQGTPAESGATDPYITSGDILIGDVVHEMPLYRVKLSSLTVTAVEPLFNVLISHDSLQQVVYRPNLLVNGDFQCNQRNQAKYSPSGWGYTVDMWRTKDGTVTKTQNGISVTGGLQQMMTVVLSGVHTISAKVLSVSGDCYLTCDWLKSEKLKVGINTLTVNFTNSMSQFVGISCENGASVELEYIRLDEGTIPLPHMKEDYATALNRCRRYLQVHSVMYSMIEMYYTSKKFICVANIEKMASKPTATIGYVKYYDTSMNYVDAPVSSVTCTPETIEVRTSEAENAKHSNTFTVKLFEVVLSCEPT